MSAIDATLLQSGIAIIGLAGRYPGARNVEQFWENLRNGVESIEHLTDDDLIARGVSPQALKDPNYVRACGSLSGVPMFDAGYFGFSPKDAAITDPQHRHFLECAVEAFEHSGHSTARFDGAIGVFAGCGMNSYFVNNLLTNPEMLRTVGVFLLRHTGNDRDFLSTTVSYKLNLRGPSMAVQTACSTSLVAIHVACQSLLAGECDMALAGGSTIMVPNGHGYVYRDNEPVSPDGHCRAFDADSAGTVLTSGAGAIVLRRLEDALEDGDTIHAVIRGSAVNNDGAGKVGYLAPSVEGHASAVAEALSVADLTADAISYVEAHGTGTRVGDPIEISALTQAFRATTGQTGFCRIGSVKTNIGHLDTAAGVASLTKVVGALKAREIPPSLHFRKPNPEIDFANSPFVVNAQLTPWESGDKPRRAGVSSLGIGGTNAHVILEEAPPLPPTSPATRRHQLLPLSAKTRGALDAAGSDLAGWLDANGASSLADVAFTLQEGRDYREHRMVVTAGSAAEAAVALRDLPATRAASGKSSGPASGVAFMFSGAGAQYPNMGRDLYDFEPVFREAMDDCFRILRPLTDFDLKEVMYPEEGQEAEAGAELELPSRLCPAVVATEWATARLWASWGVEPSAVIGHSLGEYVAACLAGVMSLEDMLRLVVLRGNLISTLKGGAMLSLPLSEKEARDWISEELDLAAVNSPGLCVASGALSAVQELQTRLAASEIEARLVPVDAAGHSRHLDPILELFRDGVARVRLNTPEIRYVSNVTGDWIDPHDVTTADYWVRHLRGTVRFSDGLQKLIASDQLVLLEVGPGQTLCTFARQQSVAAKGVVPSFRKASDEVTDSEYALGAFGKLWVYGYDVDWNKIRPGERRRRIPLPTYPFEHKPYWVEPGEVEARPEVDEPLHRFEPVGRWLNRVVWQEEVVVEDFDAARESELWLVFLDKAGVGAQVASAARDDGVRVVTVEHGDAFFKFDNDTYAIAPEMGREAYEELFVSLEESESLPQRIVHLWTLAHGDEVRAGSSLLDQNLELGFYSVVYLMQALGEHCDRLTRLDLVTNGVFAVSAEDVASYPEKATLLGPVRVVPREFPNITTRLVDVILPPAQARGLKGWVGVIPPVVDAHLVAALGAELYDDMVGAGSADVVALRGGRRFVQRFVPPPKRGAEDCVGFKPGGVYLITGGLGGLGFSLGTAIASAHKARVVLVGRRGFPEESAWDQWLEEHDELDETAQRIHAIRRIRADGGDVWPVAADITDQDAMRRVVEGTQLRFGPVSGVLHAAGAVSDGVLQTKSKADIEGVFAAKIHGTLCLDRVLEGQPLDFFIVFSSTSAVVGLPGQVDYAGANAYLDAFAEQRTRQGKRTLSLGWGVWNDVGGAVDLARSLRNQPETPRFRRQTSHALLGMCIEEGARRWRWVSRWSTSDSWVLDEHRTGDGVALLPGTGYLDLALAAYRDMTGQTSGQIQDVAFLSPLIVTEGESCDVTCTMTKTKGGWAFQVATGGGESVHATMNVRPLRQDPARDAWLTVVRDRQRAPKGACLPSAQEAQLGFGPRWSSIRAVGYGLNSADAELELAGQFHADFDIVPLHPALLDIATSIGVPTIEGWKPGVAVYVPLAYSSVRVYGRLEPKIRVQAKGDPGNSLLRDVASFDLRIMDQRGVTLMEVDGYQMRKMEQSSDIVALSSRGKGDHGAHKEPTPIEAVFLETYDQGIRLDEGIEALTTVLSRDSGGVTVVCPVSLDAWKQRVRRACQVRDVGTTMAFERPDLDSEYEPPRDAVESELVSIWKEFLGVGQIGIHDDFFDLGGHSLIAVRIFAKFKKRWGIDWPISMLFDAPTIGQFADLIRREVGDTGSAVNAPDSAPAARFQFLVPMNRAKGSERPPLFVVAGMFGNVLNLRHFAAHLGDDQPVYALQAKGLLGNDEPHRSFVDAARDYLEEIKQVAPHGPYLLGGFSGGGVTAFEIAHQLLEAGEEVGSIIMLDAIPPHPAWPETTIVDRAQISWQRFRREVLPHPVDWIRGRIRWEFEKRERRNLSRGSERQTPAEFRSKSIEIAFRESLNCYEMRVYPGKLTLFRPPIDQTYKLWGGRCANVNRELMEHKNWWQPWTTQEVEVHVVPGDHDSMVLEPNVNVLAQKVRETLDRVQHQVAFNATAPDAPNAAIDEDASRVRGQTYARTP